jgi:hypothetical protein
MGRERRSKFANDAKSNADLASSLAQRATQEDVNDITINARKIGIIPNDITKANQNAILLNQYLIDNQNTEIMFLSKNYYFDNTVTVTGTNKLIGKKSTKFILTVTNKDAFRIKPFSGMESISIELPANHNMAGIKVGNSDDFSQWSTHYLSFVRDIFIYGNTTGLSNGIQLEANEGFNVTNFTADNVTILNCNYGIYTTSSGTGWVNGNNFINVYPQNCKYGIYNMGSGNKFIYSVQMGALSASTTGVYCGGNENLFSGKVWDVVNGQFVIETSSKATNNTFNGQSFTPNIVQNYIKDRGTNNTFVGDYLTKSIPTPSGAYRYNSQDTSQLITPSWANHFGLVDDLLMFCDKTSTVNLTSGSGGILSGSIANVFSNKGMLFNNATTGSPIIIEIVLPTAKNFISTLGVTFQAGLNAGNIKIEYASSSGGTYSTLVNLSDNVNEYALWSVGAYGVTVQKIKITLSQGVINVINNPNGLIGLWNIFMFGNGYHGNLYLPRSGGDVYDDLLFYQNKGIVVKTPDGTKKYRISIDNAGALTTTLIT